MVTTYLKVYKIRSNWFLFRRNAWIAYVILVVLSFFDWLRLITTYNLQHLPSHRLDVAYLLNISDSNLDILYQASNEQSGLEAYQRIHIKKEVADFVESQASQQWQSWSYADWRIQQTVMHTY